MHGHHLNYDLPAQFSVPERVDDFSLNLFLAWLDECTVCLGYPDEYFVNMLESRGDTAHHNDAIVSILDNYAPIALHGKIYQKLLGVLVDWFAMVSLSVINVFLIGIAFKNLIIVGITCNEFLQVTELLHPLE